jgi:putative PIN family toxin of toxin-antitoxin system
LRVFLDTNIVVSAVATRGLCSDLLQLTLAEHELVVGETVLKELRRVLARKLGLPRETVRALETFLRTHGTIAKASGGALPRRGLDPADARVLAEAVAAGADVLVTGDREFLEAVDSPVEVVSPRALWERFRTPR